VVTVSKPGEGSPPVLVPRGCGRIKGARTGFFTIEEKEGIWWFITPDGEGFYAVGTDHANYEGHFCEKLGYAPYRRNCENRYGEIGPWASSTISRLSAWGFNVLGWGHSPSLRHLGLAHTESMEMGTSFVKEEDISPPITWTGFPDVFSPNFSRHCDEVARVRCAPNRDDPSLLGYFIDNELEWFGRSGTPQGLFQEALRKDAAHPAKIGVRELLADKYQTVEAFNRSWDLELAGFEEVLSLESIPQGNVQAERDAQAFLELVAEGYFSATTSAVRRYDPNHLILGCRFGSGAPDVAWEVAGRYCDAVSVNCYRKVDLERGVLADGFEQDIEKWYFLAKRPLMMTEWSFPALDAGLPCTHGAGQRVPTQEDRARAFTIFQRLLFSTPFMIASHYFMWVDEPALGISAAFPEDSNYGLVNELDDPYPEGAVAVWRAFSKGGPMIDPRRPKG
jgi:agarase